MCEDIKSQLIPMLRMRDRLRDEVAGLTSCIEQRSEQDKMYDYFKKRLDSAQSKLRVCNKTIDLILEDWIGVDALKQEKIYPNARQYHKG